MNKHSFKQLHSFLLLWGSQTVSQLGTAMTDYAVIIWVYSQKGTASSVTFLTICVFLPTIFFRFLAGSMVDRWKKKRIMLAADMLAACGSLAVLALHTAAVLQVWHLYVINSLLSLMNAFQEPASFVAVSMLVPKEHYVRASGLQGFSGAAVSILAPALGALLMAYGGLDMVLVVDLATFTVAFLALLFLIRIPEAEREETQEEPFSETCLAGIRYLREHAAILRITLFLAVINFLAKLGNDGMLSPFILGRTGNNQPVLGAVECFVALGVLAGSLLATLMKPAKKRVPLIFVTTGLVFSGSVIQGMTSRPWLWCAAAFGSYLLAAVMNANEEAVIREKVPPEMQGRVFSAKSTLQNFTIPIALLLGGVLADRVFEPFMAADSPVQQVLSGFFGTGKGSGIGLMFFITGTAGMLVSFTRLRKPVYRELDRPETDPAQMKDETEDTIMNSHKGIGFFSGFPERRFTEEIARRLEKELPVRNCLVFITACPADYQRNDEDSAGMHGMFTEYGIGFNRFCVVDNRMEPATAQQWAREADCFFLMGGGSCAEQMQLMREKGIYDIVREGPGMVLGVSAGSMNMGKTTVDIWESPVPYEGLGFADITMIGHFSYDDRERLRLMMEVSMERPVCAMQDESALFIRDGKADIIGTIYRIEKGEIRPFTEADAG